MKKWIKRILPRKRRVSSTSQHPDAQDTRPTTTPTNVIPSTSVLHPLPVSPAPGTNQSSTGPGPTGTTIDVLSTSVSRLLPGNPVSPALGTSCVDPVQSNVIGHTSCIDRHHQHGSQIITLRFSTKHQAILHCEQACTGSWLRIQ